MVWGGIAQLEQFLILELLGITENLHRMARQLLLAVLSATTPTSFVGRDSVSGPGRYYGNMG